MGRGNSHVRPRSAPRLARSAGGALNEDPPMGKGNKVRKKEVKKPKQDKNKKGAKQK